MLVTNQGLTNENGVELIQLNRDSGDQEGICRDVPNLYKEIFAPTGGLLGNPGQEVAVVCSKWWCQCWSLSSESPKWTISQQKLSEERKYSASIVIGNGKTLWITGGRKVYMRRLGSDRSTELVTILDGDSCSFSVTPGPDLPEKMSHHCLAKLNSTTSILIGGTMNGNKVYQSTYFLDIPTSKQGAGFALQGPDLNTGRYEHACGVLLSSNPGDGQVVIVVGGKSKPGFYLRSTEIWKVDVSQHWTMGPNLPVGISAAGGVASPDGKSFLLVGGYRDDKNSGSKSIFRLEYPWKWTELDQKLQVNRKEVVVMLVPDSFC